MSKSIYFIRVQSNDNESFQDYLERNGIDGKFMSVDMRADGTGMLYSLQLSDEEASTIRLSFSLSGFLNFNRALNRQVDRRNVKIALTTIGKS